MKRTIMLSKRLALALILALLAGLLVAQPMFKFNVNDLEATNRVGTWLFDFDSPTFFTHDGNWFTFGPYPTNQAFLHYNAETTVLMANPTNEGGSTVIYCTEVNTPITTNPYLIGLSFSPFGLAALEQVNLVNPGADPKIHGESGDIRTYSNSDGYITYNGDNVLYITDMEFEITTPYPTGAEIRAFINTLPIVLPMSWGENENIGPGLFNAQQGHGTGTVDISLSDPAWAALFATSNYRVKIDMVDVLSRTTLNSTYHDFQMVISADPEPNVPIVMSSFTAGLNSENLAILNWTTASESDLVGFRVMGSTTADMSSAINLTPVLIPAQNCSCGATYSFTAWEFDSPGTYYFWLESMDMSGASDFFGPVSATISETETPALPIRSTLGNVYPNPFLSGSQASIPVEIKAGDSGDLSIYNLAGQRVASFGVNPGYHTLSWNGLDRQGKACASGIYFYRLSTPEHKETRKLILLK